MSASRQVAPIIVSERPLEDDTFKGFVADCPIRMIFSRSRSPFPVTLSLIRLSGVSSNLESFSTGCYQPGSQLNYEPPEVLLLYPARVLYDIACCVATVCSCVNNAGTRLQRIMAHESWKCHKIVVHNSYFIIQNSIIEVLLALGAPVRRR